MKNRTRSMENREIDFDPTRHLPPLLKGSSAVRRYFRKKGAKL